MPTTIITAYPGAVENLPIGIDGAVDWEDPDSALYYNDDSARVQLGEFGGGGDVAYTNYLYFHNFGLGIPFDGKLDGIEVSVRKRGTGTFEDYFVSLYYSEGAEHNFTTPGRQKVGAWSDGFEDVVYGSLSDRWSNNAWTTDYLNNDYFGFVISGSGEPNELDGGQIDSVTITAKYHLEFNQTPTGGSRCGGTAAHTVVVNSVSGTGVGSKSAGSGLISHGEPVLGGAQCAGEAPLVSFIGTNIGATVNSTATVRLFIASQASAQGTRMGGVAGVTTGFATSVSGGASSGGVAPFFSTIGARGGAAVGRTGIPQYIGSPRVQSRSALVGGSGFVDPYIATGGAQCSGDASVTSVYDHPKTIEGMSAGGTATATNFWPGTGGATAAGQALLSSTFTVVAAGARLAGEALVKPYHETGAGGAGCSGEAEVFPHVTLGGVRAAGDATVTTVHQPNVRATEYDFVCRGENVIPADTDNPLRFAVCNFFLNTTTNLLRWQIVHNLNLRSMDPVQLRGPATITGNANTQISINLLQPTTSPIVGSATVTNAQKSQILAGQWYLYMQNVRQDFKIRGQLDNFVGVLAGDSSVGSNVTQSITAAGVSLGGTASHTERHVEVAVGGVIALPENTTSYVFITATGGARAAGTATGLVGSLDTVAVFRPEVALADILDALGDPEEGEPLPQFEELKFAFAGGEADVVCVYVSSTAEGAAVGGLALREITPVLFIAGLACNGSGNDVKVFVPPLSGGMVVAGLLGLQITTNSVDPRGGARLGTKARVEYLKQTTVIRRGYGAAMGSDNILTRPRSTATKLIDPVGATSPELATSRFRMRHTSGWCDFGESCKTGYLPKVIKNRQGRHLPSKTGEDIEDTSGQVASSS